MGAQNDSPNSVILRSRRTTLILLRVERASLIVVFKNSVDATLCLQHIERTADLVRKGRRSAADRSDTGGRGQGQGRGCGTAVCVQAEGQGRATGPVTALSTRSAL